MGNVTLVGLGHVVIGLVLTYHVLRYKHRPVSAVLWLVLVWTLPYVGGLTYLAFGVDRVRRGAEARDRARRLVARRARGHPNFDLTPADEAAYPLGETRAPGDHVFRATDPAVRQNRVLAGHRVELLVDGDQFYPSLLEAVENAEDSIHLQTYILGRGPTGREILDAAARRAREGVEVRLLYDRFGSAWAHYSGLFGFFDRAREAGVEVSSISQANPLKGRFQINLRNHRKVAIFDGRLGFVGGINLHERNTTSSADGAPIRDYHVRLEGPAVADLQFQFIEDWHFATGKQPEDLLALRYFPSLGPVGKGRVQVVPGGPEREGRGLADAFFAAIVAAERSLTIVTPYFVPDEPIVQAIRYAAVRGVDVRIVLPRYNNHWYMGFAARSLYESLLEAGVRIFERAPPFMHAKALIVDGEYAMLGSANLDYRSLHLNFETNLEVVDEGFLERLNRQVAEEIERSLEVTLEAHRERPLAVKLAENACYLFQPML